MKAEWKFWTSFNFNQWRKLRECSKRLGEADEYLPDAIHDERHLNQVGKFAGWIADAWDLDSEQMTILKKATLFHDTGYAFADMGILKPEEHAIGSALIALSRTGDAELAYGIAHHSDDKFPEKTPDWVYVLRDADRETKTGWLGIIAVAYYQGFHHELVDGPVWKQLTLEGNDVIIDPLWDGRYVDDVDFRCRPSYCFHIPPEVVWTWTDYEEKAADFVRKNVFPFLLINPQAAQVIEDWLSGDAEIWQGGDEKKIKRSGEPLWEVEPVLPPTWYLFSAKRFNTEDAYFKLREYKDLRQEDLQKMDDWINGRPKHPSSGEEHEFLLNFRCLIPEDKAKWDIPEVGPNIGQIIEFVGKPIQWA